MSVCEHDGETFASNFSPFVHITIKTTKKLRKIVFKPILEWIVVLYGLVALF